MKATFRVKSLLLVVALCACLGEPPAIRTAAASGHGIIQQTLAEGGTVVARLDNGLTVIAKATRMAPVVCVRAYVRAGGLYEREYLGCGISHLCEHLLARGATHEGPSGPTTQPRQRDSAVARIGGQSNASTSMAWTQYYISAAAGKAMDCIDVVADWVARPQITEDDFRREQGVILREQELGLEDAEHVMWYTTAAEVFGTHPAGVPVIGFAEPLRGLTHKDVLTYSRRMYVPQNIVMVIVGDVDVEAVLKRACAAFAGFQRSTVPDLSLPEVRPWSGLRRTARPHPGLKEVLGEICFQSIPLQHEDLHALDVLATALGDGEASRLVRKVRRELKLVNTISAGSWTPEWGRGMFTVSYRAQPEKADAAEKAILDELKAAAAKPVAPDELARAKRQIVAEFIRSQQSVERISAALASDYISTGDVNFSRDYTRRIEDVTAEQVHAAARRYLTPDRMLIVRLEPAERFTLTGAGGEAAGKASAQLFALPNGLRVVLCPTDAVGLVAMAFVTRGGLLTETPQTNGIGGLMTALSTKGAGKMSADDIARFFAAAGGGIGGGCGSNTVYWQATVLADSFSSQQALAVFADVIQRPTFDAKELEILRPQALAAIDRLDEDWYPETLNFFRRKFYGDGPYGMPPEGRKEVVQAVTAEQIAAYHRQHIRGGDSVLAIFGRFDAQAARKQAEALFADLPPGRVELKLAAARTVAPAGERHVLKTAKQEVAAVMMGAAGMTLDNLADRFPIDVLDTIISGWRMPGGWLHDELRGRQLVYVVHAHNWPGLAPGAFMVYAAGQPEKAPQIAEAIRRNLARAADYRPTQEEIDQAVNTILTAELLQNQTMNSLAMSAALDELYGFGHDFRRKLEGLYRKVTPDDVARVARKYLAGGWVTVIATPRPELVETQPAAKP